MFCSDVSTLVQGIGGGLQVARVFVQIPHLGLVFHSGFSEIVMQGLLSVNDYLNQLPK